jgi:hypothetical protein
MPALMLVSLAALPIVIACVYAGAASRTLSHPALFAIGGAFEGYVIAAAVLYWALSPLTSIGISGSMPGMPVPGPLAPFERVIWGVPIIVAAQLFAMWVTHRALAHP